VLVCGSRDYTDRFSIEAVIEGMATRADDFITIIEGGAAGADTMAWNIANGSWPVEPYPADWNKHGKAAGPIRNKQMLEEGKPDVVWAFVNKPLEESRGTANMVKQARAAGVPVYVVHAMNDSDGNVSRTT